MAQNEWDEYAADWDSNEDVRAYAIEAYVSCERNVFSLIPDLGLSRVLDFGCGTGLLTQRFASRCAEVVAVDASCEMIKVLRAKLVSAGIANVSTVNTCIDARAIGQHAALREPFDLVVASSVCSFLPDYESTLNILASMLRPGGIITQWDWLEAMPVIRICAAFEHAKLNTISVGKVFSMQSGDKSTAVVMGVAQKP